MTDLVWLAGLGWEDLGQFKAAGSFPGDYPPDSLTFYSPRDEGVHSVILWTLLQAQHSVVANLYGINDPEAVAVLVKATTNPSIYTQISLDSVQEAGPHAAELLKLFNHDLIGNSIAIGRSIKGAISHDKILVVDGLYMIDGSTNWSMSGEQLQDNQLTLSRERPRCAEARAIMDLGHDAMLEQMAKKAAKT